MGGNPHGGRSGEFHVAKPNVCKTITNSAGSESSKHCHDRGRKPHKVFWGGELISSPPPPKKKYIIVVHLKVSKNSQNY